jgi:regulatory protein
MKRPKPSRSDRSATVLQGAPEEQSEDGEARDPLVDARNAAIRLLARREHSTDELRRKLKRRGYGAQIIDEVVTTLRSSESVSDARFAESFARVRSERGQGPLRIRAELRERGVTDVLVDEVLTTTSEYWLAQANRAIVKRFGEAAPESREEWNRQARFLAQRGFPSDLIYRALGEARS